jgi:hypothetical protein
MPSRPSSHALVNTTAPSAASASPEQNSADAGGQLLERLASRLERPQALIVAIEAQKIEGDERGLRAAALGHERAEVAPPVVSQHDRFAVDERPVHRQTADRLGDP